MRTALITGGNRGIGFEIARQLAARGLRVVVGSRDEDAGAEAAQRLPGEVRAEQLDVADPDSVTGCAERLSDAGIDVDVLVNNAGIYITTPLLRVDEGALMETLEANVIGAWRTSRAFVPAMRERGWGRVVNVSTGDAHFVESPPRAGAYSLSQA